MRCFATDDLAYQDTVNTNFSQYILLSDREVITMSVGTLNGVAVSRGDIFYVNLSNRVGSEQKGNRPCIVVSNRYANQHSPVITVVPVSSQVSKYKLPTHLFLDKYKYSLPSDSIALAEQVTSVDKSRLGTKHPRGLSVDDLSLLDSMLKIQLSI